MKYMYAKMEGHELGSLSTADSQQSRRLACERCRGQKLKCERSPVSDSCQRCAKADVKCSFGTALPPGRPRSRPAGSAAESSARGPGTVSTPRSSTDTTTTYPSTTTTSSTLNRRTSPDIQSHDHQGHQQQQQHLLSPPASTRDCITIATSWPQQLDPQPADLEDEHMTDLLCDGGFSAVDFDANFVSWSALGSDEEPYDPTLPWPGVDNITDIISVSSSSHNHSVLGPAGSTTPSSIVSSQTSNPPPPINLVAIIQRVTELGNVMLELHTKYSQSESTILRGLHGSFPVNFAGEVLQLANEFLKLVRCFFIEPSSHTGSTTNKSGPPSNTTIPTRQLRPNIHTDMPAALQLIASHQRLLDLYRLFYKTVYEYVRTTEFEWRQNQPIWKDLTLGKAPLSQFPDLHIKLVLQVAARVLEDVEACLGLSEGCRVSRKLATEGEGILSNIVTSHFVEMCMAAGDANGPDQGWGAITRIRQVANVVTSMLDGPGVR